MGFGSCAKRPVAQSEPVMRATILFIGLEFNPWRSVAAKRGTTTDLAAVEQPPASTPWNASYSSRSGFVVNRTNHTPKRCCPRLTRRRPELILTSHERPAASATASINPSSAADVLSAAALRDRLFRQRLPRRSYRGFSSLHPCPRRRMVLLQKDIQQADRGRALGCSDRGAVAGTNPDCPDIARSPERRDRAKTGDDRGVHRTGAERASRARSRSRFPAGPEPDRYFQFDHDGHPERTARFITLARHERTLVQRHGPVRNVLFGW